MMPASSQAHDTSSSADVMMPVSSQAHDTSSSGDVMMPVSSPHHDTHMSSPQTSQSPLVTSQPMLHMQVDYENGDEKYVESFKTFIREKCIQLARPVTVQELDVWAELLQRFYELQPTAQNVREMRNSLATDPDVQEALQRREPTSRNM